MKKVLILGFIISLSVSCASLKKANSDSQSEVINLLLKVAAKKRDSIYIIDINLKNRAIDLEEVKILTIKNDSEHFKKFKEFLLKEGIEYGKEFPYFEKQAKNPIAINKEKIKLNNIRFFTNDIDMYFLNHGADSRFPSYYYNLPRVFFTKNGRYAIIYQKKAAPVNYFLLFKKVHDKWMELSYLLEPFPPIPLIINEFKNHQSIIYYLSLQSHQYL